LETTGLGPLTRTHEPHIIRPVFRVRSLRPSPYQSSRALSLHTIPLRQVLLLEMSNCYRHPGRAGGTPITLARAVAAASRVAIVVVAAVIIALGFLGIGVAWLAKKTPRLLRGGRAILRAVLVNSIIRYALYA
jgi:hypothetical protein